MDTTLIPTMLPSAKVDNSAECDFTIVIAHRGPLLGLWATVESCINELNGSGYDYNFVVVVNGEEETLEHKKSKFYLGHTGHLRDWIHRNDAMSPPSARQLGTETANGKLLFFLDNHCLPNRGYFDRAVKQLKRDDVDMIHSTTAYYSGFDLGYHYKLCLERNFWGTGSFEPQDKENPYRVAMGGHGGFAIRRAVWNEVGGYWMGFRGYGGEEPYFDLKMWLLGKQVWLDPKMIHHHFAGERPYPRHFSDDYYRNMLMCANIIGGQKWMYRVYNSFSENPLRWKPKDGAETVPLYDILTDAYETSRGRADWLAKLRGQTLDELIEQFAHNAVAH